MNSGVPPSQISFTDKQREVLKKTIADKATDAELDMFIQVCIAHSLNPFKKEIFFSKNVNSGKVDFITSRDGYLAIIQRDPKYTGLISMEVYTNDEFEMKYEGGEFIITHSIKTIDRNERGDLIGAWASCSYKDRKDAVAFAYLEDYKKVGHKNWDKYTSAMIRKVPESIVLKRQGGISGLVTEEEIVESESDIVQIPSESDPDPIQIDTEPEPERKPPVDLGSSNKVPEDVTDQYVNPEQVDVILTRWGDIKDEYTVAGRVVIHDRGTNTFTCRPCKSSECDHVQQVKLFIVPD